ncbi:MAG TPA: AI-2E family transporter [Anaerolineales bacterium]|jgi:predicted PurR-regulated permease PerM|nr:AI-2E family transporter [Anaerolineales bacterium]
MIRIVKYVAVILATLAALILVWQFNIALVLFLLSLAVAAAFRPEVDFLSARNIPRIWSLFAVYVVTISVLAVIALAISGPFLSDLQQITDDFTQAYERAKMEWPRGGNLFQRTLADQLPPPQDLYDALSGQQGLSLVQTVFGMAANIFNVVGKIFIVLILSLYWSVDRVRFERLWLSLIPANQRMKARDIWRDIEAGVGAYIRSEVIQSILAILLLWLGYWVIGLRYPTVLAIAGALFWLIPWLGALLAVVPPLLVGLGATTAMGVAAALYTLLVLVILEFIIEPRFFSRKPYSSLLVVLLVIAFALSTGLVGVLFAPPLAAALQILFSRSLISTKVNVREDSNEITKFTERIDDIRKMVGSSQAPPAREVTSLLDRLEDLVNRSAKHFDEIS